jgi:Ca2+-transporting ATPase
MRKKLEFNRIKNSLSDGWGLTLSEISSRETQYGLNDITQIQKNRIVEIVKQTAKDPMIWFLIGTSLLFALLKNYNQTIILLIATIPLMLMDTYLHWRTESATLKLSKVLLTQSWVLRDNQKKCIPTSEIVPGDLVFVESGHPFPADGIIVGGNEMKVDESMLTGESYPVQKSFIHALPETQTKLSEPYLDDIHWGFAGTRLLRGSAKLRVVYTGPETLYGKIVISTLKTTRTITPLQKSIAHLVFSLIIVATVLCIILAIVRYLQGFGIIDAILSAAILAVAALPDEFPVVFTLFMGLGVYRLAKQKALVRRGVSVENIGRVNCICSDKTGTLTEGRLKLIRLKSNEKFTEEELLNVAIQASSLESGDFLDTAIFELYLKQKKSNDLYEKIETFPFTEYRKRETSLIKLTNEQISSINNSILNLKFVTKGSPEVILSISNLSEQEKVLWTQSVNTFASEGYKVLAVAQLLVDDKRNLFENDSLLSESKQGIQEPKEGFQFVGLLVFFDPPRKGVAEAIQKCYEGNIHVLMITGDHLETARTIAKDIGLGSGQPRVILAEEAKKLCDQNHATSLLNVDVIARALPTEKLLIVHALQSIHKIVAVTGDGVNDVPALKAADVGIAMGERGTQSAREVSDIILLDDNFSSIVNAIAEGKQLFKNLKLSYLYLLLIHMPFVLSAAIVPLLGYPLIYFPIHIVWIELLIHPTSMLIFQDFPESEKIESSSDNYQARFFSKSQWIILLTVGTLTSIFIILGYLYIYTIFKDPNHGRAFTMGFLGIFNMALILGLGNFKKDIVKFGILISLVTPICLIQIPLIAEMLNLKALTLEQWGGIGLANIIVFLFIISRKGGQ